MCYAQDNAHNGGFRQSNTTTSHTCSLRGASSPYLLNLSVDSSSGLWSNIAALANEPPNGHQNRQTSPNQACIIHGLCSCWQGKWEAVNNEPYHQIPTSDEVEGKADLLQLERTELNIFTACQQVWQDCCNVSEFCQQCHFSEYEYSLTRSYSSARNFRQMH